MSTEKEDGAWRKREREEGGEFVDRSFSSLQRLSPGPHCTVRGKLRRDACVRNTEARKLCGRRRYAKQISSSCKFGCTRIEWSCRLDNGEIKERTGDEWQREWEQVVESRSMEQGSRGTVGEARERKPSERNYRRWSLKSSNARRAAGIVDLGFADWTNLRVTDSRKCRYKRMARDRVTARWEQFSHWFFAPLFFAQSDLIEIILWHKKKIILTMILFLF